ncbi:hypothetical protein E2C01_074177 [Portunus trituberculatus]|uniref:Uncharacterized protein n=1 Tax=Portunus trituberculatus TaxID=210409 RepID=A0A5B7I515_PORTR|nr:hypothetical protein [Portunus trituberculatus]
MEASRVIASHPKAMRGCQAWVATPRRHSGREVRVTACPITLHFSLTKLCTLVAEGRHSSWLPLSLPSEP